VADRRWRAAPHNPHSHDGVFGVVAVANALPADSTQVGTQAGAGLPTAGRTVRTPRTG
jgi:hypothetical protein